jgi:hypothetical protein
VIQTRAKGCQRVSNRRQSAPNFDSREDAPAQQNSVYIHRPNFFVSGLPLPLQRVVQMQELNGAADWENGVRFQLIGG